MKFTNTVRIILGVSSVLFLGSVGEVFYADELTDRTALENIFAFLVHKLILPGFLL